MNVAIHVDNRFLTLVLLGIVISGCILFAYVSTRYLMLIALAISCAYILCSDDEQSTLMLIFLFFFSTIFKLQANQTSLFVVCKVAYIFRMLWRGHFRKIKQAFLWEIFFIEYCILSMFYGETSAIIRILNLTLWMAIAYLMITENIINRIDLCKIEIIAFFLSCIIAKIGEYIPAFALEISNELVNYDSGYGAEIIRYTGIFADPNMTTVYIILTMFACLYLYDNSKINGLYYLVLETILTLIGIATGSKSCFLLMIVFWATYLFSKTSKRIVKGIVLCMAIIVLLTFAQTTLYKFYSYRFFGAASGITTNRTTIWTSYINQLNDGGLCNWLLGYGINTSNLPNGKAAHNSFLQIIYNCGLAGLLLFLIFWFSLFRIYIHKNFATTRIKIKHLSGLMPVLCILAITFFLDAFFLEGFYFAIPISLLMFENAKL